jgi:hypothetical protein
VALDANPSFITGLTHQSYRLYAREIEIEISVTRGNCMLALNVYLTLLTYQVDPHG